MTDISFSHLAIYFVLYSIVGWVCETVWCSIGERRPINRGFLFGPWCPVYGFGALLILLSTADLPKNPLIIFLFSMVSTSALEYLTGWLMEALFQTKWWDYSERRFNLRGRVCLGNSLLFGLMGLLLTLYLHPAAERLVGLLSAEAGRLTASLLISLLILDLIRTLYAITGMKERFLALKLLFQDLDGYQKEYAWFDRTDPAGSIKRLREICERDEVSEELKNILGRIDELGRRRGSGHRIFKAFPKMQPWGHLTEFETLKREWQASRRSQKRKVSEWKRQVKESYRGVTLSRMVWVFLIGCVIGYIVETAFCLITTGAVESRQGMLYGPFSQVYGFGAVLLALLLIPLAEKSGFWLFLGSAVAGGMFEVLCSLIQEAIFGSVSWQYSGHPFAFFGGRTSLMFMFFWGVLGTVYMRGIYPRIVNLISRLAVRPQRFFSVAIAVILSANMLLSAMAVDRWSERASGLPARSGVDIWLDESYPDEMLEDIYPNMVFLNTDKPGRTGA